MTDNKQKKRIGNEKVDKNKIKRRDGRRRTLKED